VDTSHIFGILDHCGENGTIISRTIPPPGDPDPTINTLYGTRIDSLPQNGQSIQAAQILNIGGSPPQSYPGDPKPQAIIILVTKTNPQATLNITIKNQRCGPFFGWTITTAIPWLTPSKIMGAFTSYNDGLAVFYLDASSLGLGEYQGQLTYTDDYHTRNVSITLFVVDRIFTSNLPLVSNTH
jgi:hypothetical protein